MEFASENGFSHFCVHKMGKEDDTGKKGQGWAMIRNVSTHCVEVVQILLLPRAACASHG
jgi:hypothetical protein